MDKATKMIKKRFVYNVGTDHEVRGFWLNLPISKITIPMDFVCTEYLIKEKVYSKETKKFITEIEKLKMWEKLQR